MREGSTIVGLRKRNMTNYITYTTDGRYFVIDNTSLQQDGILAHAIKCECTSNWDAQEIADSLNGEVL